MIVTFNQTAKYGPITAEYEHFVEWKDPYPYTLLDISAERNITSQQILAQGTLTKDNLLDILHTFTLFKEDPKGGVIKVVSRYQQFRAVKKIIKRLKEGKTPEERGGIVWHTKGSGKSITMMFTVREMYRKPEFGNFKIVFITDRKDLEKQLNETSKSVGFTVHPARNIRELQNLLKTNTPDLVIGMIHKFQGRELKTEFPLLNTSPNILIMIDEAHRTQYELLGANLRKSLPNAVKIAFTGTPIEKTEETFRYYIDKYSIRQSVDDGVTVKIVYEGRVHSAELTDEEKVNAKFEDVFSMLDTYEKAKIMGKYTWRAYLEDENVIKDKARDMMDHYIAHVFPNGFKAQVVTVSRLAGIRYKKAFENALREKIEELKKNNPSKIDINQLERLKVGVVVSGLSNDPPDYHPYTDTNEHEKIIRSFKLPFDKTEDGGISGDVGILVVQSMLLTGFDAPIEQVMYLDNVIKEHSLLQAIARVNRVYKNKSCGFVVDYVGVLKHLRESLAIYADEDIDEIARVVKNKGKSIDDLKCTHSLINEFFKKYGIAKRRDTEEECIDLLVEEEVRNEFIMLVRRFNRAMDVVLPDPEALKYITDLRFLNFIKESARKRYRDDKLSIKDASRKIREIVEEYLISKGVDPKIPPTPLLDDKFISKIKKEKSSKTRAKELKHAIIDYIDRHWEEDPEFYERFSDRLRRILKEYRDNWEIIASELEKLREAIKLGREAEETFGLEPKREMPFFGLLKQEIYNKKPVKMLNDEAIGLLIDLTKDVVEIIRRETQVVGFWESYPKQKRLKSFLISRLLEPVPSHSPPRKEEYGVKGSPDKVLFGKRNEIAQKLMELAYHIYGK